MSKSKFRQKTSLVAVIADEDTATGFLLAGVGNYDLKRNPNFFVVSSKTKHTDIEDAFKRFSTANNIGIILITQQIADDIRYLIKEHDALIPTILEIPNKHHPYDPKHDSVMIKINKMLGGHAMD